MAALNASRINEPVVVTATEHGYFPKAFVWRGRRHRIQAVERCWTVSRRHWLGRVLQHCFRVRTPEATYVLSQDISRNTWRLDQVVGSGRARA